jgi:hypothetical protein
MSALPPKADIAERDCDVRFVPKADVQELRAPAGGQRCALDRSGTQLPRS